MQKEIAGAIGKESARQVLGFVSDILRPPAKELGGLLAHEIKFLRFKRQIQIFQKAKIFIDTLGVNTQKIPTKFLANFLDFCSWEEDENMRERWALLLANCATEGESSDIYMAFPRILNELSPLDAKYLDVMYDEIFFPARRSHRNIPSYQSTYRLADHLNLNPENSFVICDNLERLNLVQVKQEFKHEERDISFSKIVREYEEVSLTYLGNQFVKKCRLPYSSIHSKKIRKLIDTYAAEIAKQHDGESFQEFCKQAIKIYPHLIQSDLNGAVLGALNKIIWKGGKIKEFKNYSINNKEKSQIADYCVDYLEKNNQ